MTFKNHIVIDGREDGFTQVWILRLDDMNNNDDSISDWYRSEWPAMALFILPAHPPLSCVSANKVYDTNKILLSYSSLVNPRTVYEFDMETQNKSIKKITACKGFVRKDYEAIQIKSRARADKRKSQCRLRTRRKKTKARSASFEGYGSYGISNDPAFDRSVVPLLDRGVTITNRFTSAEVGNFGRSWYEDEGKYLNKMNTFYDFIDCGEYLCASGWTSPETLAISGRSAGGLLMGAVTNMAPDLFKCVVGRAFRSTLW